MSTIQRAIAVTLTTLLVSAPVWAQTAAKKELTPQQQRMGQCAHEGKGKKGDEYKAFMKDCLKSKKEEAAASSAAPSTKAVVAKPVPAAAPVKPTAPVVASAATATAAAPAASKAASQKDKMKDCNAQAKTKALKGDERKTFMSTCLRG